MRKAVKKHLLDILTLDSGKHQEINKSSLQWVKNSHGDAILIAGDRRLTKLEKRTSKKRTPNLELSYPTGFK